MSKPISIPKSQTAKAKVQMCIVIGDKDGTCCPGESGFCLPRTFLISSAFFACSLRWIFMCRRLSSERAKRRPQTSQANGFSPVCVLMWVVRWSDLEKFLMQILHWKGFWPVCVRIWRVNSSDLENLLGQLSTRHA